MRHGPRKVLVFMNRFLLGGQERQTVLHLRTVDRTRWQPIVACFRVEGEHVAELEEIGAAPESLDIRSMGRPHTAVRVLQLAQRLRRERIAIVHSQDYYTDVLGTLAARLAGIPSIVTRVDLSHQHGTARRAALAGVSRLATRVLVNALCIRDLCLADGVASDRIAVVRNGMDLAAFDAAAARTPALPVPAGDRPTIVNVANMHHPVKGQEDLLVAMREVVKAFPRAQLVLVGGGDRMLSLEKLANDLDIRDAVHFLGHRTDVPALMSRATLSVSASYAEGISNAIMEGMAARRPVVGTAVGGTPELVREGVTGWLVPPGAPAHMARRIVDVLRDPEAGRRMGEAGRKLVATEFTVEQMKLSYEALYSALAESSYGGGILERPAALGVAG
ncbi:MAG TPA: glycosyltransferase [Anaeromyxobacteraceae bacterium]|nr:glycosyltransferase [Anaeromyxobacteraceae bacterium]